MTSLTDLADLHCHLMPYVDDGAYDGDECLALLKAEAKQGVRTICLTPHLRADMFETSDEEILRHFELVRQLAREAELPLELFHSREYHFDQLFRQRLCSGQVRPLGAGNTLLVEFGGRHSREDILEAVKTVGEAGYVPLIAHVERYAPLQQDWSFALELRRLGALLQLNAGSVLGHEGLRQRLLCRKLLQKELVTVIASDAHDTAVRTPQLRQCAEHLESKYGRRAARLLLSGNPKAILEGRPV